MDEIDRYFKSRSYLPPFRTRNVYSILSQDADSADFQILNWDILTKRIQGIVNRVNCALFKRLVAEAFSVNIVRGRGILVSALMKTQQRSPSFSAILSAFVAVLNSRIPQIGELLLTRLALLIRRSLREKDHYALKTSAVFAAQLLNFKVCHEILILQVIRALVETKDDRNLQICHQVILQCGYVLSESCPRGLDVVFDLFRTSLQEGLLAPHISVLFEELFQKRKAGFPGGQMTEELDFLDEEDIVMHEVSLDDESLLWNSGLDRYSFDPQFARHEETWRSISSVLLGGAFAHPGIIKNDPEELTQEVARHSVAQDTPAVPPPPPAVEEHTNRAKAELRKRIYLVIKSSVNFEEVVHKIMKLRLPNSQIDDVVFTIVECCGQEKTYSRFFGLLCERLCLVDSAYKSAFERALLEQYLVSERLRTPQIRNIASLFSHLLTTKICTWACLSNVRISEDSTNPSKRIFLMVFFQTVAQAMGSPRLIASLLDFRESPKNPGKKSASIDGLVPLDNAKDNRFSRSFWDSIRLPEVGKALQGHIVVPEDGNVAEERENGDQETGVHPFGKRAQADPGEVDSDAYESDDSYSRRKRRRLNPGDDTH
eukprot:ANDGO_00236.mRNA.1 Pre-mRNA-splicing factor CWC22